MSWKESDQIFPRYYPMLRMNNNFLRNKIYETNLKKCVAYFGCFRAVDRIDFQSCR